LIYNAWPYADSDLAIDNMDTTYGWFVVGTVEAMRSSP